MFSLLKVGKAKEKPVRIDWDLIGAYERLESKCVNKVFSGLKGMNTDDPNKSLTGNVLI